MSSFPKKLQGIVEEFALCDGQEKLEHLLYYAERIQPLPDWLANSRDALEPVHECMTPVFIHAHRQDDGLKFYFDVPAESPTVRGFAAFLAEGTEGATAEEIISIPEDFFWPSGLHQVLSSQRLNGLMAILAHMKRLAVEKV
jgi:cysteine desulfuration protein SufE